MDDLQPLLKVLPAFQQARVFDDPSDYTREYLPSEHLDRFQMYARRIINLHVEATSSQPVRASVLLSLFRALGHQPLLPRLRTLTWEHSLLTDHDVLYFVSPSLRSLTFQFLDSVASIIATIHGVSGKFRYEVLCEQVAAAVPYLEELTVLSDDPPTTSFPSAHVVVYGKSP
ncbi:uncharacterized protein B0H18DRAFT_432086 [Fomitopsis serialis]|uniref:uncharacterized protein n=1 Tax=Fomitopsis serialis TaxID=139415 RepID=UPI0020084F80|nr:uncharacterized protein B0H18DRAFT_432086 [Neoantrodia serialis]KAH9924438.1 hypothetical protein B0H18DRAFT_432086 [Neoantrodia serialis]